MSAATYLRVIQGSDEWLAEREQGIGSSDIPVIAGERDGLLGLWAVKAQLMEPTPPDEKTAQLFRWGHLLEPVIAQVYSEQTGRALRRVNRMLQSREWPVARASIDREAIARRTDNRAVEIKNTRSPRWDRFEAVPGDVQAQCQWQCYVGGYDVIDVAVLAFGSDLRIFTIERDDAFIADLLYLAREFWGWVETRTRPPLDGSETTARTLSRLHPADDGEILPASEATRDLARQWAEADAEVKAASEWLETVRNATRGLIGDASGIDGLATWRRNRDSTRVNWPAVASAYRTLAAERGVPEDELDTLASIHSETVAGARVLRPVFGKEQLGHG